MKSYDPIALNFNDIVFNQSIGLNDLSLSNPGTKYNRHGNNDDDDE